MAMKTYAQQPLKSFFKFSMLRLVCVKLSRIDLGKTRQTMKVSAKGLTLRVSFFFECKG